jgi:hypothetical protein
MGDIESKVLARELGKLGGIGARWGARFLPTIAYETEFTLPSSDDASNIAASSLTAVGKPIPELPSVPAEGTYYALVGSGRLNLNPTVLRIKVRGQSVSIRAVAKEGAITQHSARLAVERLERAIRGGAA